MSIFNRGSSSRRSAVPGLVHVSRSGLATIFLTLGCASPGLPRPPSLNLPRPVTDLTASRTGDRVDLHWTIPTRTTDGLDLTSQPIVIVCRDLVPPTAKEERTSAPCTPVTFPAPLQQGVSSARDILPAYLLTDATPRPWIAYRLRILNPAGHSAQPSTPAFVPGGRAPQTVRAFHATQQRLGVVLEWQNPSSPGFPTESEDVVEVIRTQVIRNSTPQSGRNGPTSRTSLTTNSPVQIHLRADTEAQTWSPAGLTMIDQSAPRGETYLYSAQRVRLLTREGMQAQLRSESTPPVTVSVLDTFSPNAPTGLFNIPVASGGLGKPGTIDLSWEANTEPDLAGYLVYRGDLGSASAPLAGKLVRLTNVPVSSLSYRDTAVLPSHRYVYRVTAIDQTGNESPASLPTESFVASF